MVLLMTNKIKNYVPTIILENLRLSANKNLNSGTYSIWSQLYIVLYCIYIPAVDHTFLSYYGILIDTIRGRLKLSEQLCLSHVNYCSVVRSRPQAVSMSWYII